MAAPPSLTAPYSLLLFLSSFSLLLLLLLLLLSAKKRTQPRPGCGEKERLDLRGSLPAWDPQPKTSPLGGGSGVDGGGEEEAAPGTDSTGGQEKGRRKKARKKRIEPRGGSEAVADGADEVRDGKVECTYPFSTFASATQRKIKLKYDEIVNSNQAKTLTMAQVGQFVNCLVDARNELQRKSETIQRSFRIKKALLCKANKSSFDRLCQQIYKLEAEHKRLEEDATVYNLLQEQLKLSPAYKTMLEVSTNLEQKSDSDQDNELPDITFEELLAQEKKDLFWQKNRKLR